MELRDYIDIIRKRKWLFIYSVVLLPLFVFLLMTFTKPIYSSEGRVWIKGTSLNQAFIKDTPSSIGKLDMYDTDNLQGTLEEMIEGSRVINDVITRLGVKNKRGELVNYKDFINPNLIGILVKKKGVYIKNPSDTEAFRVIGYSDSPQEATAISEQTIASFSNYFASEYNKSATGAIVVLQKRIAELEKEIAASEVKMVDYKVKNEYFNLTTQINTYLAEISNLEATSYTTERTIDSLHASLKVIGDTLAKQPEFKNSSVTTERNPIINEYKKQLLTLETDYAKQTSDLMPEHPDVMAIAKEIDAVRKMLVNEIEKTFGNQTSSRNSYFDTLVSDYGNATIDIVKNTAVLNISKQQTARKIKLLKDISQKEVKYNELTRDIDSQKSVLTTYLTNLEAAKSSLLMNISNVIVIQPPVLFANPEDQRYFPAKKKTFHLILAAFMGGFIGIATVFVAEYLDDGLWTPSDIEKVSGMKVLSSVKSDKKELVSVYADTASALTEGVHNLLANTNLSMGTERGKSAVFISPSSAEGKTTMAANFAAILAKQGKKTLMVDGNFRHPSLHLLLDSPVGNGFGEYLEGKIEFDMAVSHTKLDLLDVVAVSSNRMEHPQSRFDSDRLRSFLTEAHSKYDFVVFDSAAADAGSDALVLSKYADNVFIVVEQKKTTLKAFTNLVSALKMANMNASGVVLNKVKYI